MKRQLASLAMEKIVLYCRNNASGGLRSEPSREIVWISESRAKAQKDRLCEFGFIMNV